MKGHGRLAWRKGVGCPASVNIGQSCSGTIELTIPLKSRGEVRERICPPLSTFFSNPFFFLDSGGYLPFLALARCPISRKTFFFSFLFFKEISNTFRGVNKNASEKGDGGKPKRNFLYFSRSNRTKGCCHRCRQRPINVLTDRLFIYSSLPFRYVVTACAKKKKRKKKNKSVIRPRIF